MSNIDQYVSDIIKREGGYVDHPNDKGGPTNFGITQAVARSFGYGGNMRDMPRSIAESIYKYQYWERPNFDKVALRSEPIAIKLFDAGINMGPRVASTFLQRSLNVLKQSGKLYGGLVADGVIGNMTIDALAAYLKNRGQQGEQVLLNAINCLQGARYIEITEGRPQNESFIYGWLANRVVIK